MDKARKKGSVRHGRYWKVQFRLAAPFNTWQDIQQAWTDQGAAESFAAATFKRWRLMEVTMQGRTPLPEHVEA